VSKRRTIHASKHPAVSHRLLAAIRPVLLTLAWILTGCQSSAVPMGSLLYDYRLLDARSGEPLSLAQLVATVADSQILFVGELHTHPAVHLFEAQLLDQLHQQSDRWQLSMEQFERPAQAVLERYLNGEIGEQTLIRDGHAWSNYPSDYRPLVDYARLHGIQVLAANAPTDLVRCIHRRGLAYLEQLPAEQRRQLAEKIHLDTPEYREKFMAFAHPGMQASESQHLNRFAAQATRDDTMAESLVTYLKANSHQRLLHISGAFHVSGRLGTVERVLRRQPDWPLRVIVPITSEQLTELDGPQRTELGDFLLLVNPLPPRFVGNEAAVQLPAGAAIAPDTCQ